MSFLNNPENNPVKVIILLIIIAACGYFVYNQMHSNALSNLGQVRPNSGRRLPTPTRLTGTGTGVGTGTGTGTTGTGTGTGTTTTPGTTAGLNASGTTKGGTTTADPDPSCDTGTPIDLTATLVGAPIPTSVTTASGGVSNGQWLRFRLTNPTPCPTDVSRVVVDLGTNELTQWPPVQNIKLMTGMVQRGALFNNTTPSSPTYISGPVTLGTNTINVSSSAGIPIGSVITIGHAPVSTGVSAVGTVLSAPTATTLSVNFTTGGVSPATGTGLLGAGPGKLVFDFPGASAVNIPAGASVLFAVRSESKNVAIGPVAGTGVTYFFNFRLQEVLSRSTIGSVWNNQTVIAGTLSSAVVTPNINIY